MGHERLDLNYVFNKTPLRRWRAGILNGHTERFVTLGRLDDGRFYANHSRKPGGAFVFTDERGACELADKWLGVGEWKPVPACYDARGMPADNGDWWLRGQEWLPGPKPE